MELGQVVQRPSNTEDDILHRKGEKTSVARLQMAQEDTGEIVCFCLNFILRAMEIIERF